MLDYSQALMIDPNYAKAYNNRGIVYRLMKQYDQAISDYNKALKLDPKFGEAYNNRGVVYYLKGEYEKSWEDVKKAQNLGYKIHPEFLANLRKASGRQN
jgi:tetratricopeptide (TPR) repeat protein